MEVDPLYKIQVVCLCCEQLYRTSRVRPSFKKAIRMDADFCGHYKSVNPDYYVVRVCPFCGFAFTEHFSERMTPEQRKLYYDKLGNKGIAPDLTGERDWNGAMQSYKLALLCAQIKEESQRVLAGLLHHIAWLYRYAGDLEQEERFLRYALEAYVKVYESEASSFNNARLMYLIGELHRRLRDYSQAIFWFGRVIDDKKMMDAAMIRACREQWKQTREDMMEANIELPDEMKKGG